MRWDVAIAKKLGPFALDVAFRAEASRLVLFGPSGAGKSLTLKAIAGLLRPDAGWVRVDGDTVLDVATKRCVATRARRFGYLFQDYALFPHLTIRQNVAFGLADGLSNPPRRRFGDARDERVSSWLATFELDDLADRHPDQLSGGQRQRTALARALVAEPRALLLDEPFSALDVPLRKRLRDELLALQRRLSLPMILISHDPLDAEMFGERVVAIAQGRVVDALSTAELSVMTSRP